MAGYLSWLFPRCKISPKLNGTAPHFGDEMFALVLFVCYLDGGCEDIVVDVYNTEQQCLYSMSDQRIRQGGCFPIEDFIDGFWRPAQEYGIAIAQQSVRPQRQHRYQYNAGCQYPRDGATVYDQTRNDQHL